MTNPGSNGGGALNITALLQKAGELERDGHVREAIGVFEESLRIAPDHLHALLYQGNALLRLGREDEALESYKAFLDRGGEGEAAERTRRILEQLEPEIYADEEQPPAIPALVEDEEPVS